MLRIVVTFVGGLAVGVGVLTAMTWSQANTPALAPTKERREAADGFHQGDLSSQLAGISTSDSIATSAAGDQPPGYSFLSGGSYSSGSPDLHQDGRGIWSDH